MFFGWNPLWKAGHASAGVNQPGLRLVPGGRRDRDRFSRRSCSWRIRPASAAEVKIDVSPGGRPVGDANVKQVPAGGRLTVNIEQEDPALANAAVVDQRDGQPSLLSSSVPSLALVCGPVVRGARQLSLRRVK